MPIFDNSPYVALSEDGTEVIIKRFDTPRPWSNYLTNGDFTAIVTQMGAGFDFLYDSMFNQGLFSGDLTLNEPIPGRYLYLHDADSGVSWNPTITPGMRQPDRFEARHGLGYTTISSAAEGIASEITYYVPLDRNEERWLIRLRNEGSRPRRLQLYSYCELVLGNIHFYQYGPIDYNLSNQVSYQDHVLRINRSRHQHMNGSFSPWPYTFYAYADRNPQCCIVAKEAFVGRCRTVLNPVVVEEGRFEDRLTITSQAVASFGWAIELAPGEEQQLTLTLGIGAKQALPAVDRDPASGPTRLAGVKRHWRGLMEASSIDTPDAALNVENNYWIKYQATMLPTTWRTFLSLYGCSGGPSFRNVATDLYGIMPVQPEQARDTIIKLAARINQDGTPSQMTPRPEIPFAGNEAEKSDFLLWYLFVIHDYVKETGETGILDLEAPYMDGGSGTIFEHLIAGIDAVIYRKGAHGLPLIKYGDWNDALSAIGKKGRGESVWLGQFFYFTLGEALELFAACGKTGEHLTRFRAEREAMRAAVNEHAWNGEYFVRAFADDGTVIGTKDSGQGRLWLNPQSWAVIADIAAPERLDSCLAAIDEGLLCEKGYALYLPAYTADNPLDLGVIKEFAPGTKENGAIFSHANAFAIIALAKYGRGDQAHRIYRAFSPFSRSAEDIERAGLEPYVFSQYLNGPEAEVPGDSWYPWTTGTSGWSFRCVLDWIIGVRAEHAGLRIDPCIPAAWDAFSVRRRFRGATYHIRIQNPQHVQRGVVAVEVDGVAISGNLIPLPRGTGEHRVEVRLG